VKPADDRGPLKVLKFDRLLPSSTFLMQASEIAAVAHQEI
jgi:hypothetical protein